jgi:hypothetical protein
MQSLAFRRAAEATAERSTEPNTAGARPDQAANDNAAAAALTRMVNFQLTIPGPAVDYLAAAAIAALQDAARRQAQRAIDEQNEKERAKEREVLPKDGAAPQHEEPVPRK